jgi:hypothetical protein
LDTVHKRLFLANFLVDPSNARHFRLKGRGSKPKTAIMKTHLPQPWTVSFVFLLTVCSGVPVLANEQSEEFTDAIVLDSLEVDLGERSIFYNRVEPPVLKPWVEPVMETEDAMVSAPTTADLAEEKRLAAMRHEWMNLEAAVYVGRGSEVRMQTEEGEVVALSSIDFRLFDSLLHFEQQGVIYNVFCMAHSWTKEELAEWRREDPAATWPTEYQTFPSHDGGKSKFQILAAPSGKAGKAALEAMAALHAYHDANRKALVEGFALREEARLASEKQEAESKANPTPPEDTVINYFLIESPETSPSPQETTPK